MKAASLFLPSSLVERLTMKVACFGPVIGALVAVCAPSHAYAYCRTTTQPQPAGYLAQVRGCWSDGAPLYWSNACVSYNVQQAASKYASLEKAQQIAQLAFGKWTNIDCPGGGKSSIQATDLGPVACGVVQYNQRVPNQHVIVFRDNNWPHGQDTQNTLGLTTLTFEPNTGEIYDADMEINSQDQALSASDAVPTDGYDIQSIITHEAGHFFGLAHSDQRQATMFPSYETGSARMRDLSTDDIAGICAIYPNGGKRIIAGGKTVDAEKCDPTPRHGFSSECAAPEAPDPPGSKGCSATPLTAGGVGSILFSMSCLLLRRTRREGRAR